MNVWSLRTGALLAVVLISATAATATHGPSDFTFQYVGSGDTPTFSAANAGLVVGGFTLTSEIPGDAKNVAVVLQDKAYGQHVGGRIVLTYAASQVTIRFCGSTPDPVAIELPSGERPSKIHFAVAGPFEQNHAETRQLCGSSFPFVDPMNPTGATTGTIAVTFS